MQKPFSFATNLYWQTSAAAPVTTALEDEQTADVIIVGGGYTGLSAAVHLAEKGFKVHVLEAGGIGFGCSGRNGGQVNPGLKNMPETVERDFGPDLGKRMVALSYGATSEVFELIDRLGVDCSPRRTGTLRTAINAASEAGERVLYDQGIARSMPFEWLDAAETRRRTGTDRYCSALFDPRGGHINPLAYARGLATAAMGAGARISTQSPASNIQSRNGDWSVSTPKGAVTAPHVIVATNGYTGDLWPDLRKTIVPVNSTIMATDPLPDDLAASILPARASVYEIGWDTVYYRIDADNRLLVGGRTGFGSSLENPSTRHLMRHVQRLWPILDGIAWPWKWAGTVALTTDHYPHISEPQPGVHTALGYNGRGVAMATVVGRVLAERIAGSNNAPCDLPAETALRPIPFHAFNRLGIEARILYGRLRDRLGV